MGLLLWYNQHSMKRHRYSFFDKPSRLTLRTESAGVQEIKGF